MHLARRVADAVATADTLDVPADAAEAAALRSGPRRVTISSYSRLFTRVAPATLSVALVATIGAVTLGGRDAQAGQGEAAVVDVRADALSRSAARAMVANAKAEREASAAPVAAVWSAQFGVVMDTWYAQSDVTVRSQPSEDADELGEVGAGEKVQVTEREVDDFREVVVGNRVGWVPAGDVAEWRPAPGAGSGGVAKSPGKTSSTRVLGLTSQAMGVYNAVMGQWGGAVNSVGGYRSSSLSDHQYGRAIDFMLTPGKESALGWTIARYLAANASTLGVDHIIFEQKIWTPSSNTWRPMANRGSITANHFDHVHVSVER